MKYKFCPKCLEKNIIVEMELVEGEYLLCKCGYNSYEIGYQDDKS
jgi:hypothetical protein